MICDWVLVLLLTYCGLRGSGGMLPCSFFTSISLLLRSTPLMTNPNKALPQPKQHTHTHTHTHTHKHTHTRTHTQDVFPMTNYDKCAYHAKLTTCVYHLITPPRHTHAHTHTHTLTH